MTFDAGKAREQAPFVEVLEGPKEEPTNTFCDMTLTQLVAEFVDGKPWSERLRLDIRGLVDAWYRERFQSAPPPFVVRFDPLKRVLTVHDAPKPRRAYRRLPKYVELFIWEDRDGRWWVRVTPQGKPTTKHGPYASKGALLFDMSFDG